MRLRGRFGFRLKPFVAIEIVNAGVLGYRKRASAHARLKYIVLPIEHRRYPGYSEPGDPFADMVPRSDIEVSLV